MNSVTESSPSIGPTLPVSETYVMSDDTTSQQLTFWSVVRPVSQPATPDSAEDLTTLDGSGPKPSVSSKRSNRKSSASRTYPVYGRSMQGVPLEKSSGNLPDSGILLNGDIYALPTLALPTSESASLLWPTVTTDSATERTTRYAQGGMPLTAAVQQDWRTPLAGEATHGGPNARDSSGSAHLSAQVNWPSPMHADGEKNSPATRMGLPAAVAHKDWPTPVTPSGGKTIGDNDELVGNTYYNKRTGKKRTLDLQAAVQKWPTPTVNGNYNRKGASEQSGTGLATAAKLWATPQAFDSKDIQRSPEAMARSKKIAGTRNLREEVQEQWATPQARDYRSGDQPNSSRRQRKLDQGWSPNLNDQVVPLTWPTPRETEWKGTGPLGSKSHAHMLKHRYLSAVIQEEQQVPGKLNPSWVGSLMGFPTGWLDLDGPPVPAKRSTPGKRRAPSPEKSKTE